MSHLVLNQDQLLQIFEPQTELDSIIRHYESEFEKKGEVICRIKLNDLHLSEEDEHRFSSTPIAKIQNLEVATENPNQLYQEVLDYWKQHLPTLVQRADALSENLRFKSLDQNAFELSQFIDQCQLLVNSLNSISSLCQHRNIPLPARWTPTELKLWMAFNELLDSFSEKNTNLMADSIEYDLAESLQIWQEILIELA